MRAKLWSAAACLPVALGFSVWGLGLRVKYATQICNGSPYCGFFNSIPGNFEAQMQHDRMEAASQATTQELFQGKNKPALNSKP